MSKNKRIVNDKKKEIIGIGIIIVVTIAIVITIFAVKQSTEYRQHASSFQDLNSADAITQTTNPDGTMGATDYTGNFANQLPDIYLGTLDLQVTDPVQGPRPTDKGNQNQHDSSLVPTHLLPTQAQVNDTNGPGDTNKPSNLP